MEIKDRHNLPENKGKVCLLIVYLAVKMSYFFDVLSIFRMQIE